MQILGGVSPEPLETAGTAEAVRLPRVLELVDARRHVDLHPTDGIRPCPPSLIITRLVRAGGMRCEDVVVHDSLSDDVALSGWVKRERTGAPPTLLPITRCSRGYPLAANRLL